MHKVNCVQDSPDSMYGCEPETPFLAFMTVRNISTYFNMLLTSRNRYQQENVPNAKSRAKQSGLSLESAVLNVVLLSSRITRKQNRKKYIYSHSSTRLQAVDTTADDLLIHDI
jgi:hypothetical protein